MTSSISTAHSTPRQQIHLAAPWNPPFTPLTTFAFLWATATLIHLLSLPFWARTWQGWVLIWAICLVLVRPHRPLRLIFLIAASLQNLFRTLPFVPNHILFEGLLNLTLLLGIFWIFYQHSLIVPGLQRLGRQWLRFWPLGVLLAATLGLLWRFPNETVGGPAAIFWLIVWERIFPDHTISSEQVSSEPTVAPLVSDCTASEIYHSVAPLIRLEVYLMYFWAGIQKLNWDYLNPQVSCAAKLHQEIAEILPFLPTTPFFLNLAIWGSLVFELGIPLLLMFSRTRVCGFVAAIFFHLWLSIHPFPGIYSYSALIIALLFFFLSPAALSAFQQQWAYNSATLKRWLRCGSQKPLSGLLVITVFYVAATWFGVNYRLFGEHPQTFFWNHRMGFFVWLIWGLGMSWSYLRALWQTRGASLRFEKNSYKTLAWLGVLLVFCNGLNPWIGLKTQTSFSMFSNLRTEFEINHLFLKRWDLFDYQRNMVEVLHSEPNILAPPAKPRGIQQFANPGTILPFFELRRLLSQFPDDVVVQIKFQGKTQELQREKGQENHPIAFKPLPWYEAKFLWFRRHVEWDGSMHCTH